MGLPARAGRPGLENLCLASHVGVPDLSEDHEQPTGLPCVFLPEVNEKKGGGTEQKKKAWKFFDRGGGSGKEMNNEVLATPMTNA